MRKSYWLLKIPNLLQFKLIYQNRIITFSLFRCFYGVCSSFWLLCKQLFALQHPSSWHPSDFECSPFACQMSLERHAEILQMNIALHVK